MSFHDSKSEFFFTFLAKDVKDSITAGLNCILVHSCRLSDTVVWNPWPEKGEAMADLGYLFLIGNYFVKSEIK